MKLVQKKLSVLLALAFVLGVTTPSARAKAEAIKPDIPLSIGVESGENSVSMTFNVKKGSVHVYGTGEMKPNVAEHSLRWFHGYEDAVKSLSIERGVKSIGDYAFGGDGQSDTKGKLPFLKKVKIAGTVEKIGRGAFYGARSLKEIDIPGSVKEIGSHAFNMASGLTKVTLHEGLEKIGNGAFMNCDSLKKIIIPDGITIIPDSIFYKSLQEITLPKTTREIKSGAFQGQINATIYSKDATIEEGAFPPGSIITCYKGSLTERSAKEKGNLSIAYVKEKTSVIKSPKPSVKVKRHKLIIKCAAVSNAVGYQIRFSKNKNMRNATVINKKSYISKKLKKGDVYYVQARAYDTIIKDKINGKWSKTVSVKIK